MRSLVAQQLLLEKRTGNARCPSPRTKHAYAIIAEFLDATGAEFTLPVFCAEHPEGGDALQSVEYSALKGRIANFVYDVAPAHPTHSALESLILAFEEYADHTERLAVAPGPASLASPLKHTAATSDPNNDRFSHGNSNLSHSLLLARNECADRIETETARRVAVYKTEDEARIRAEAAERAESAVRASCAAADERHEHALSALHNAHQQQVSHLRGKLETEISAAAAAQTRGAAEQVAAAARETRLRAALNAEMEMRIADAQRAAAHERELLLRLRDAEETRRSADTAAAQSLEKWKAEANLELEARAHALARNERRLRDERATTQAEADVGRAAIARLPSLEYRVHAAEEELEATKRVVAATRRECSSKDAELAAARVSAEGALARLAELEKRLLRAESDRVVAETSADAARLLASQGREQALRAAVILNNRLDEAGTALRSAEAELNEARQSGALRLQEATRESEALLVAAAAEWERHEEALVTRLRVAEEGANDACERADEEQAAAAGLRIRVTELTLLLADVRARSSLEAAAVSSEEFAPKALFYRSGSRAHMLHHTGAPPAAADRGSISTNPGLPLSSMSWRTPVHAHDPDDDGMGSSPRVIAEPPSVALPPAQVLSLDVETAARRLTSSGGQCYLKLETAAPAWAALSGDSLTRAPTSTSSAATAPLSQSDAMALDNAPPERVSPFRAPSNRPSAAVRHQHLFEFDADGYDTFAEEESGKNEIAPLPAPAYGSALEGSAAVASTNEVANSATSSFKGVHAAHDEHPDPDIRDADDVESKGGQEVRDGDSAAAYGDYDINADDFF